MFFHSFLTCLLLLVPSVLSIKCHITGGWVDARVVNTTAQDCPLSGSQSCTKTVNLNINQYFKQCSTTICNGTQGANVAQCNNNTVTMSMECCCTGDGCNSSSLQSYSVIFYWPIAYLIYTVYI